MTKKFRFMTGLLAVVLAFVMLSSVAYIAAESDHDCTGVDCAICHQINVCENLLKPVKIVEGIVEKRQTLPILSNILIEQNGENVKFSATDLDIQISTEAPVGVAGVDTRFTVGASKLASILTALPATNEVQFDLGDRGLTISSNNGKFQLQTLSADEYPVLKESQWETTLFIPSRTLRYLPLREDLFAAHGTGHNKQKSTVDDIRPGEVLVIDARGDTHAGTIGDIL